MQVPENEVFLEIKSGQVPAFEMLFKTYYQSLCRYATTYLKDPDEAEEIVQAAFIGIWEKRASISIETSIKSYLYRTVRNSCLNELKHEQVKQKYLSSKLTEEEKTTFPADQEAIHVELEEKIRQAIGRLPEQCRLIFTMSRFEELKYQEIADQLNLSVKTVENQMGKALKLMRIHLKEYLPLIAVLMNRLLELG
ncbi:RNA polymerase sigma-70 factor [Algoriphagus lacus]|uniref:RNA polymerase sigma-70 factor n=1 Tax=Algoriphagus lacus TaxID=2056311 RepID=A0A418PVF2_9BACT|nr:RNA polymerase sigma-70 factor [Algoriphagus lacus]RIW17456.1 RNA polymerase sigma-70 factor [Algoriphagus lacus]